MTAIGKYITKLRTDRGLTQRGLALKMEVSNSSISKIENGERLPKLDMLDRFSKALHVDLAELIAIQKSDEKDSYNIEKEQIDVQIAVKIPLLGVVRAGVPILATENIEGYLTVDMSRLSKDKSYYGLRIKGDSMDKRFTSGTVIIVEKTEVIENGEIAVVGVNGNEATVKKVMFADDNIALIPESNNPAHVTKLYNIVKDDIHILGKAVQAITYL